MRTCKVHVRLSFKQKKVQTRLTCLWSYIQRMFEEIVMAFIVIDRLTMLEVVNQDALLATSLFNPELCPILSNINLL